MEIDSDCSVEFLDTFRVDNEQKAKGVTSKRKKTNIIELDEDCYILSENNNIKLQENNKLLNENSLSKVCIENKMLGEFIKKCFEIEHSTAMSKLLNNTLLNIYYKTDYNFKTSALMKTLLHNAINSLEVDPDHRFIHVKRLCEGFNLHGIKKKRAELTTLATNLTDKKRKTAKKHKKSWVECDISQNIINLDDIEVTDSQIINVDEDQRDIIFIDDADNLNEKENLIANTLTSTKNLDKNYLLNLQEVEVEFEPHEIVKPVESNVNKKNIECKNKEAVQSSHYSMPAQVSSSSTEQTNNDGTILCNPAMATPVPDKSTVTNKEAVTFFDCETPLKVSAYSDIDKIKVIESEIAQCKKEIAKLDEEEVVNDTMESPYILSAKHKAQIVELYKQLCQITGSQVVKQRKVHLQLLKGYPPGPVRRLEKFLNNNLRSDGYPSFPDLHDVVRCVTRSNDYDNLGWSKARVMDEARSLFFQCGKALQKQRQAREYRDLISKIQKKYIYKDPADEDSELLARLENNRKIGTKKETDLLERFSMMQNMSNTQSLVKLNTENNINPMLKVIEKRRNKEDNNTNIKNHTTTESENHCKNNELKISKVVGSLCMNNEYEFAKPESQKTGDISSEYTITEVRNTRNYDYTTEPTNKRQTKNHSENSLKIAEVVSLSTPSTIDEYVGNIKLQKNKNINNECTVSKKGNHSVNDLKTSEAIMLQKHTNTHDSASSKSKELPLHNIHNDCTKQQVTPILNSSNKNLVASCFMKQQDLYNRTNTNEERTDETNNIEHIETERMKEQNRSVSCKDDIVAHCSIKQKDSLFNMSNTSEVYHDLTKNKENNETEKNKTQKQNVTVNGIENESDQRCLNKNINESRLTKSNNSLDHSIEISENSVIIKKEPGETLRLLEQIGDDYTATILDIEDPFIIIELSDSSDSEDESR